MTDRDMARLQALLTRFRDEQVWDRRERPNAGHAEERAVAVTLSVVRETRQGRPMYRFPERAS